jgi:hypothetical protein
MANRFPLVVDASNLNIKEIPSGDNLDLAFSGIVNAGDVGANNITLANNSTFTISSTAVYRRDLGILNANTTVNVAQSNFFTATANANLTFTFAGARATGNIAEAFVLELANGGNFVITWPSSTRWPSNTAPTLSTGNTDILVFITDNNGSLWRAASQLAYRTT